MKYTEDQYQMSNEFAVFIIRYLKENNINFIKFCQDAKLSTYMTRKIIDRKIKMHIHYSYLKRIADYLGTDGIILHIKKYEK